MTVKVGDVLFASGEDQWKPEALTIAKVGRRWAMVDREWVKIRLDINTLEVDGYNRYGRVYRSEAEWQVEKDARDAKKAKHKAWIDFKRHLPWGAPDSSVTTAAIHQAAELLGFTITPDAPK